MEGKQCLLRGTSEVLTPEIGGQHHGELAVGSISNPVTHCRGQTVTFEKEVPRSAATWELAGS